jgi:hypothetical protein
MPNGPAKKIALVSYVCQGKCLQAAWTLPGMSDFFSELIVQKTKKFNNLRSFWGGLAIDGRPVLATRAGRSKGIMAAIG